MADRRYQNRIVVETPPHRRGPTVRPNRPPNSEVWIAVSVIVAAAIATFGALLLTSRPFDPMNSSVAPQQNVPQAPAFTPPPKSSPTVTPTPQTQPAVQPSISTPVGGETGATPDDATIQSHIENALAADSTLSKLDISTLVENGKVTVVGSVASSELKQRAERIIRSVKGVTNVDNQLVIAQSTP